jgi:hypothetical protein
MQPAELAALTDFFRHQAASHSVDSEDAIATMRPNASLLLDSFMSR